MKDQCIEVNDKCLINETNAKNEKQLIELISCANCAALMALCFASSIIINQRMRFIPIVPSNRALFPRFHWELQGIEGLNLKT